MLQRPLRPRALDYDRENTMGFEEAETIDGGATQEEILRDVGLLLAIALGFAVVVGAFFSVG